MSKCLILDINGVLRKEYNVNKLISELNLDWKPEELKEELWKELWGTGYDLCTKEDILLRKLQSILGKKLEPYYLKQAYVSCRGCYNQHIVKLIKGLEKHGVSVGTSSDCDLLFAKDNIIKSSELGLSFCFSSSIEGFCKSDKLCYELIREKLNVDANDIIFIDDNIKNIELAKQDGWTAFLFNEDNAEEVISNVNTMFRESK